MKLAVLGNCQALSISQCLDLMLPEIDIQPVNLVLHQPIDVRDVDVVLVQNSYQNRLGLEELTSVDGKSAIVLPNVYFSGYHPDLVYAEHEGAWMQSATLDYNSAIVLYGWMNGLDAGRIEALFNADKFRRLGYFDEWDLFRGELLNGETDVRITPGQFDAWVARGCFMHSTNHPRLLVSAEIARSPCKHLALKPLLDNPEDYLIESIVWPVFPEIAQCHAAVGGYAFKIGSAPAFGLRDFIERSSQLYDVNCDRTRVNCVRFQESFARYKDLELPGPGASGNPYRHLPDRSYWRRSIE